MALGTRFGHRSCWVFEEPIAHTEWGSGSLPLPIPFRGENYGYFSRARVILLIDEVGRADPLPDGWLKTVFGFAPSEARMAESLSRTMNLSETAREQRISYEHARTKLKSVFSKMNVASRMQLVSILSRFQSRIIH